MEEVENQASKGKSKENLYVISHDDNHTDRVANKVNANEPEDLSNLVGNLYNKKSDELRAIFREFDFDQQEAGDLEAKLDHGSVILMIDNN